MVRQRRYAYLIGLMLILVVWGAALATLTRPPNNAISTALPTLVSLGSAPVEAEAVVSASPSATPLVQAEAQTEAIRFDKNPSESAQQTNTLPAVIIPPDPIPNIVIVRLSHTISDQDLANYLASFGGEVVGRIDPLKTIILRVPDGTSALPTADFIAKTEPDYYVGALAAPPSDPYFPSQWNLLTVRAPQGWDLLVPNVLPVTVALIDSGICANHPELENRTLAGWDFVENDDTPNDPYGHGCGVAGVLAANANNSFGIAGVAPHVRILPLRVLNEQGLGSYSNVAAAIVYAVDQGAQIINLSLGGSQPSNTLLEAVQYARNANVLVIAASGNTGRELAMYPAAYDAVIGVGSVDPDLQRSDFSNFGASVKLYAPGRNIMTIGADGGFRTMSGTSLAAPHVAGVAAIELSLGRQLVVDGGIVAVQIDEAPLSNPDDAVITCDLIDVQTARLQFFDIFRAHLADSNATPREALHAARDAYLSAAAPCYAEIYSQPLRFDGGGYTLNSGGPTAQFQLFGTKWGQNSPFNPAQPPASNGGTVTYSFMPNGVNLASKEGINPLFSLSLSVDNLINLPSTYTGPSDIPNVGCLDTSNPALASLSATEVEILLDEAVRQEIRTAFALWSAQANISFVEVADLGEDFNVANPDPTSDIRIAAQVIDGPGAELGHAYYPGPVPGEENATGTGDLFLDADENWGCGSVVNEFGTTIDIGIVAVHEIGHAIGMSHQNPAVTALMNPSYNATLFTLQSDDIAGVRAIYGSDELGPPSPNTPIITGDQVTLTWTPTGGTPDTFQIQVTTSGDSGFASPLFDVTTDATTYTTPPLVNGTYLWRVRAFAEGAWSDYSAVGSANPNTTFIINVSVPILISPFNTAKLTNGFVEFEWGSVSGIGNTYQLQIASGPEFAQPLTGDFTVGSNLSFTLNTALADGTYFWRVRANDGDFSPPFTFSIDSNVPTLNNPSDGAVINNTSVTLTWDPVPGATEYEVHLDTSPNFVGLLFIDKLFIDKLFIDKLFIDKLFIDKLFIDKLFIDKLFIDKLFIDKLFIDKLFIDKLFIDKLFSDELFIDKLFIDKLFIDKLFIDKLFIDKLTTNSYTASNLSEGDHYWRVRARREDGSWSGWSEPSHFIIDTPKENVVINEIFPGDPAWIEIYNADQNAVDLTGWQFIAYRPDGTISTTYTFPNSFTLAAGAYVVLHEEDLGGGNINTATDLYIGANTIDWPLESPVGALSLEDEPAPEDESRAPHKVRMNRPRPDITHISRRGAGGYDRAYNDIFVTTTDTTEEFDSQCSIIEAINNANNDDSGLGDCEAGDGEDTIYLQDDETYTFIFENNSYQGPNALPPIFTKINIVGNGSTLQRDTIEGDLMRFFVIDGLEGNGDLTLSDMLLKNGAVEFNNGGAIYNSGGILRATSQVEFAYNGTFLLGGAIYNNSGTVDLFNPAFNNNSANIGGAIHNDGGIVYIDLGQFFDNSAVSVGGHVFNTLEGQFTAKESQFIRGSGIEGGAILNTLGSTLNIYQSALVDNEATMGSGGAIYNENGTVNLINSTLALNTALSGAATGGAIYNASELNLSFVTIAQNTAGEVGGGIYTDNDGNIAVKNSIIADNIGGNCAIADSSFTPEGENFDTDATCGLTEVSSEALDLQAPDYGGYPTQTMALGPSSVALETATDCTDIENNTVENDQRGISRPQDANCDVGAYELELGDTPQSSPFTVNTTEINDDGICGVAHCTILEAFNAANADGDASIINLGSNEIYNLNTGLSVITDIEVNGNNATIRRDSDAGFPIITMSDAPTLTLNQLTIRDGDGIDGGGINKNDGTLTLNDVSFYDNQADFNGGAINNLYGDVVLNNTHFENNEAVNGGAIYNAYGTVTIDGSRFIDNKADNAGGAILSSTFSGETLIISNTTISDNTATNGAGVYIDNDETAIITASTLSGNEASGDGGAIYNNGETTLVNVTLSGNTAADGGAIYTVGSIKISFSTIAQNTASNAVNGDANFKNTIVADNNVLFNCDGGSFSGSGANFADDISCGFSFTNTATPLISAALDDNGGPTETHALVEDSPAIDAATDCTDINSDNVTQDQRGTARPQGDECDAGAFEREAADTPQAGPNYTVNTTNDVNDGVCGTGHCSLREAIIAANVNDDLNQILFNISGVGVRTIQVESPLPAITQSVVIDGTSQPGASCTGFPATLLIEVSGALAGAGADGLELQTNENEIRGLVINNFSGNGIYLNGADNNIIACNYIGTNADGTADLGNGEDGIVVALGSDNNLIGGTGGFDGNLISGNDVAGIAVGRMGSPGGTNNQIYGNRIGTDVNGTTAIPNSFEGILLNDGTNGTIIGSAVAGAGNLISGNSYFGISIVNASNNTAQGNFIGTDVTGTLPIGNSLGGISIDRTILLTSNNVIGGTASSFGNLIAFNGNGGVLVGPTVETGNAIIGNSIHSNSGLGIDLGADGVTLNDELDGDSGPNNYQNYPVFDSVVVAGGNTIFDGSLESSASTNFDIYIYSSPSCDSSGFGEGQTWISAYSAETDAEGFAELDFLLESELTPGNVVTAIAVNSDNNTSEFSECVTITGETAQTNPYTVNTTDMGDDGLCGTIHCSLIEAMNAANNDEVDSTINLGNGELYVLTTENNFFDDSPNGTPRVSSTIVINGNNSTVTRGGGEPSPFRIFYVNGGNLTVNDLTVINGDAGEFGVGGAFRLFDGDTLTLNNVTVINNYAREGGAIYSDGTLIINNSEISGNFADEGGGIYSNGSTTVTNSLIDNNTGNDLGGGIYHNSGSLFTLDNTTVSNNITTNSDLGDGGGIYNNGMMEITNESLISNNTAQASGGGIYTNIEATLVISDSRISDNTAEGDGGGIYTASDAEVEIDETTIADNSVNNENSGGGIYVGYSADLEITNSTLSNNSTDGGSGAAIYNSFGQVALVNVTIASNILSPSYNELFFQNDGGTTWMSFVTMADEGDAISLYTTGGSVNVLNSIIEECEYSDGDFNNSGGSFAVVSNCPSSVPLTIVTPAQLNLQTLADNGGPTQTIALGAGSVAIDEAINCGNLFEGTVTRDQRGTARPQGDECDAGAFEVDELSDTPQTNPYTVNTTTMEDDGLCGVEHCSLIEAIDAANADGIPSTVELGSVQIYTFTTPANEAMDFGGKSALPIVNTPITLNGNNSVIERAASFTCPDTENAEFRLIRVDAPGNFTVNDVILQNGCETDDNAGGGAIYVASGATMTLNRVSITDNVSDDGGGAIRNDGILTINHSIISANTNFAGFGGGIDNVGGQLTINLSTISNNTASSNGGGVSNFAGGTVIISDSTFSGNNAATGGAIFNSSLDSGNSLLINGATIDNNNASSGGGIYNAGTLSVTNTTFSANTGAALLNDGGNAEIVNATFAFNDNSAVNNVTGALTLYNSLLAKDSGNVGDNCVGTIIDGGTNISTDTSCVGFFNLALGSLKLSPIANNGGPTFTHAIAPDSPAVDTATLATCPSTDQRGVVRPVGEGCDIGAFEFTTEAVPAVGTKGGAAALLNDGGQGEDFVRFGNAAFGAPAGTNWTGGTVDLPTDNLQSIGRDPSASDADHRTDIFSQNATRGGQNAVKVVINEIYPGAVDAIELYNASVETVNMSGWELAVYDALGVLIVNYTFPTGLQLEPNEYLVLYEGTGTDVLTGDNLVVYLDVFISWPDWNSAGAVELTNGDYAIDFVRWGDGDVNQFAIGDINPSEGTQWIPPSPMSPLPNEALGRDSFSTDTDAGADWIIQQQSLGGRNPAQPPVTNDVVDNAILIPALPYRNTQNIVSAVYNPTNEPAPSCSLDVSNTVWYRYIATANTTVRFQTDGSDFNTVLAVYTGTPGSFTEVACDNDSGEGLRSRVDLAMTSGTTYYFMIGGTLTSAGNLVFGALPPANDDFDDAIVIGNIPFTDSQNTTAASRPLDDPAPSCGVAVGRTVWYEWTPETNQAVRMQTTGSNFDTHISVWAGTRGALNQVACNDNAPNSALSRLLFQPVANQTYYIMVGGTTDSGGQLIFELSLPVPPPNDNFSSVSLGDTFAVGDVSVTPYVLTEDVTGATIEETDPVPSCGNQVSGSVWFEYNATTDATVAFQTLGSDYDTVLSIWTGEPTTTQIACNDDFSVGLETSYIELTGVPGTTYYILVQGYQGDSGNLNFSAYALAAPPTNDNIADAILITPLPFDDTQNTSGATLSLDDPGTSCDPNIGKTVWYRYEAGATSTILHMDTFGSNFDTVLAVYQDNGGTLTELICDDDGGPDGTSQLNLNTGQNVTLYVGIGGYGGVGGILQFHVEELSVAPPHDEFDTPRVITSLPYDDSDNTVLAKTGSNDPTTSCASIVGSSVFYQYTPPDNSPLLLHTNGSNFDTVLSIYTGATLETLVEVACDDNSGIGTASYLEFLPIAGETYTIVVVGNNGAKGQYNLHVEELSAPANDEFVGAIDITSAPTTTTNTTGATDNPTDPGTCNATAGRTVWYTYTTGTLGGPTTLSFDTIGSDYNTVLSVFTGPFGSLTPIACDDNSGGSFTSRVDNIKATANTTYTIVVSGAFGETGELKLNVNTLVGPINDAIENAIEIIGSPFVDTKDTSGATNAPDDPLACGVLANKTVWYRFTATSDELLHLSLTGTDFDTVVGVFTGAPGALTPITCDFFDDVDIPVTAGQTYYVMIGGYNFADDSGQLQLMTETISLPPNDAKDSPIIIPSLPYSNTQDTSGATSIGDPTISCDFTFGKSVWYQYTALPTDGLLRFNTIGSDFSTVLAVFKVVGSNLEQVGCKVFGGVDLPAEDGATYLIMVAGYQGASGSMTLNVESVSPPPNDDIEDAKLIASLPYNDTVDTRGASDPLSDPLTCKPGALKSVWYRYNAIGNGTLSFNTSGSDFNTVIAVYSGSLDNLHLKFCVNGDALDANVIAGETYYIMIRDASAKGGQLVLNVTGDIMPPAPSIEVTKVASVPSVTESGGNVTYTIRVKNTSLSQTVVIDSVMDNPFGDLAAYCDATLPASLAPNAFFECEYTTLVSGQSGTFLNTVTASGVADDDTPVVDTATATVTITDVISSIQVTKIADRFFITAPSQETTFTVKVRNTSPTDSVVISSVMDSIYGDIGSSCAPSLPATLAPNAEITCVFTRMVSGIAGNNHINTVTVSGLDDDNKAVSGAGSLTLPISCATPDPNTHLKHAHSMLLGPTYNQGVIVNTSVDCYYEVGLAAYQRPNWVIDDQVLFDFETTILPPNSTAQLAVTLPNCAAQVDLFYGQLLPDLNGKRYGNRLIQGRFVNGTKWCVITTEQGQAQGQSIAMAQETAPAPLAPSDVVATGGAGQISLAWVDTNANTTETHLERLDTDGAWRVVAILPIGDSSYNDGGLACHTTAQYRVRAYNGVQFSAYSDVVSATTDLCPAPSAPQNLLAAVTGETEVGLAWTANESGLVFDVEMSADGTNWTGRARAESVTYVYNNSALACGIGYQFRVTAIRISDGQMSAPSAPVFVAMPPCAVAPFVMTDALVGLYQNGVWQFRVLGTDGAAEVTFNFGLPEAGWQPFIGDFAGDGVPSLGLYKDGLWVVRAPNLNDTIIRFGPTEAGWQALVGDWDGDGRDGIGLYKDGLWLFKHELSDGVADLTFTYGAGLNGAQALVGDWDGDGRDTPSLYHGGQWYLSNTLTTADATNGFSFGPSQGGWLAIRGDWNGDGVMSIGLFKNGLWRLRNLNGVGPTDIGFTFGLNQTGWAPVALYSGSLETLQAYSQGGPVVLPVVTPIENTPAIVAPEVTPEAPVTEPSVTDTAPEVTPEAPVTEPSATDTVPDVMPEAPVTEPSVTDTAPEVTPEAPMETTPEVGE